MKETEITTAIIKYLKECRCFCFKHWSGGFSRKGISDVLGCLPDGRFIAIEVKRPVGGRVTEDQEKFIRQVNDAGGLGFIARSVADVRDKLSEVGVKPRQRRLF